MAIQIKLKNSVVQDSTPSTSDLPAVGEIALNANINSIGGFMRASDNTIVKIFGPGSLSTPTATTTVSGISELATNSETTTGTATNRVVTPAGLNAVTVAERTTSNTNYVAKAGSTLTGVLTMPNGSNSAPAINFGDSDSGIFGGTNTVSLAAGGTTRLTADTGVSVTGTLAVTGAITSTSDLTISDKIIHSGDTNTAIRFPAADTVSVETGGNEAIRINDSGQVLVGVSSARTMFTGYTPSLQVEGNAKSDSASSLVVNNASTVGPTLWFGKTRGTSVGSNTVVQSGDELGTIFFNGADGTDVQSIAASIRSEVDGTPGANDMPGRLVFSTTADGAASPTERLRIDNAGLVKIPDNGKFVAGDSSDLQIYHDGSHSIIAETGTGILYLGGNQVQLYGSGTNDILLKAVENGAVELYYDNTKFFETGSTANFSRTIAPSSNGGFDLGLNATRWRHIRTIDNGQIKVGTSDDLEIYHDASNSYIDNNTGVLNIRSLGSGADVQIIADSDYMARFVNDGAVELYYDNSKKLETTSTGVSITGVLNLSDNLDLPDNAKVVIGTGDDLKIYSDGSTVFYAGDDQRFRNKALNENMLTLSADGSVVLFHNGNNKLQTTSSGVSVTGTLTATSFSGDGSNLTGVSSVGGNTGVKFNDDVNITLGTGNDTLIRHIAGSHTEINHVGTGDLILETVNGGDDIMLDSNDDIFLNHAGESMVVCRSDAQVELYYDNSKKLETTSAGVTVTGTVTATSFSGETVVGDPSPQLGNSLDMNGQSINGGDSAGVASNRIKLGAGDDLQIYHDGSNSYIDENGTGELQLRTINGSNINLIGGSEFLAKFIKDGAVELYHNGSKKFETWTSGARLPSDNNVLAIGAGDDLRFWHNATNSIIRNATGQLQIQSNDLRLGNFNLTESYLKAFQHGAVQIFHDNQMKFETTSNGVDLRGTLHRCEGTFRPYNNDTWDLGTANDRWRNIYTNDLNLSNEGGANDVDGTWGSYTIQEGAESLFLINKRSGKKYKFNLTEVA